MASPPLRSLWRIPALTLALFVLAAVPVAFARFDGAVAFVWPASSLLLAHLSSTPPRRWWPALVGGGMAMLLEVSLVGIGWRGAPVLGPALLGEPAIAAVILCLLLRTGVDTGSVRGTACFIAVAGVVAPFLSGLPAAWAITQASGVPFRSNLLHWVAAHGLGAIIFTPVFAPMLSGTWQDHLDGDRRIGLTTAGLLGSTAIVSWLVFRQSALPLLFLPVLPIGYATLRGGRVGAVGGMMIVATIGAAYTIRDEGPVHLIAGSAGYRSLFFQAYLACTALLVLPVAALLSERALLLARWRESETRFRAIAESLGDAVLDIGLDGTIRYASPTSARVLGHAADALVGVPATLLVCEEDAGEVHAAWRAAVDDPDHVAMVQYRAPARPNQPPAWFEASLRALWREGKFEGVLGSIRDVSERKSAELALARDASLDPLTGLLNRRAFLRDLQARCAELDGGQGRGSLAIFDLDHFKAVNDTHGHPAGDMVLRAVADAVAGLVRSGDLVARIGGEEFALLLWDVEPGVAGQVADRLRRAIGALRLRTDAGERLGVTASMGMAPLAPGLSPADALARADAALYEAKRAGRDRLHVASGKPGPRPIGLFLPTTA